MHLFTAYTWNPAAKGLRYFCLLILLLGNVIVNSLNQLFYYVDRCFAFDNFLIGFR